MLQSLFYFAQKLLLRDHMILIHFFMLDREKKVEREEKSEKFIFNPQNFRFFRLNFAIKYEMALNCIKKIEKLFILNYFDYVQHVLFMCL